MSVMSAKKHLRELQWRFMLIATLFIIGATLAYVYRAELIPLLLAPLDGQKLVYLNPAGGFSFIFLISIYAGIALSFPIFMQQIYAFLRPALPKVIHRKSSVIIASSFLLLTTGIVFGYIVAVPNALTFLYGFADQYVEASLTADSYLNFMIAYTVGIGIVFQLPLLLLLIHSIKPLTPGGLLQSEKWVVLIAFIVAAIITPTPDPINQAIIAGPVVVIYQIGVIAVLFSIARQKRRSKKIAQTTPQADIRVAHEQPLVHTASPAPARPHPHSQAQTTAQQSSQPQSRTRTQLVDQIMLVRKSSPLHSDEPLRSQPRPRPRVIQDITPISRATLHPTSSRLQ